MNCIACIAKVRQRLNQFHNFTIGFNVRSPNRTTTCRGRRCEAWQGAILILKFCLGTSWDPNDHSVAPTESRDFQLKCQVSTVLLGMVQRVLLFQQAGKGSSMFWMQVPQVTWHIMIYHRIFLCISCISSEWSKKIAVFNFQVANLAKAKEYLGKVSIFVWDTFASAHRPCHSHHPQYFHISWAHGQQKIRKHKGHQNNNNNIKSKAQSHHALQKTNWNTCGDS